MRLDWKLLREQKLCLLTLAGSGHTTERECELLQGVVNLIDHIQEDAVDDGSVSEAQVYGEPHEV
jgi:hypothetical protein